MNMNWERKDQNVPRLEVTGQSPTQHNLVKAFAPPPGIGLIARMVTTDRGLIGLQVTWDHAPSIEQIDVVNPMALNELQLEVYAAQNLVDPDGKSNVELLAELDTFTDSDPDTLLGPEEFAD